MNYIPDKCNYLIQESKVNSPFLFFWLGCGKNKGIRFHVIFNIHTTVLQTIGAEGKRRWSVDDDDDNNPTATNNTHESICRLRSLWSCPVAHTIQVIGHNLRSTVLITETDKKAV